MINFFKSLFSAKPQQEAAPQPKPTSFSTSLLDGLETRIKEIEKVATEDEKTILAQLSRAVQQDDLANVAKQFIAISQSSNDWQLQNTAIIMSARINRMIKEADLDQLGPEKVKLEKSVIVGAIIKGLGNIEEALKKR